MPEGSRLMALVTLLLLAASLAWAQSSADAMYYQGRVKELPKKKPGKLDVSDAEFLQFTWQKGTWKVPFAQIKTVYVSLSRRSALGEAFGLGGAAVGAAKKRKLLLSLTLTDEQGKSRNSVFCLLRGATPRFMSELESKIGRGIIYESAEARKAAEGSE